jgi:hypothetical protein
LHTPITGAVAIDLKRAGCVVGEKGKKPDASVEYFEIPSVQLALQRKRTLRKGEKKKAKPSPLSIIIALEKFESSIAYQSELCGREKGN